MKRMVLAGAGFGALVFASASLLLVRQPRAASSEKGGSSKRHVELTIYSEDFALVREKREVELQKGRNLLAFADVSKELDPHSVLLRWAGETGGNPPEIVGHSYDLGVEDSSGLLKHQIGKEVEIVRYGEDGKEASRERGRLLVAGSYNETVVEIDGKLYVNPVATLVVPRQGTVPTIPQLSIQAESDSARSATIDLAYLTRGLHWSADYVGTLAAGADDRIDLECYATVRNRTSVEYPNATATLVAGSPSRAVEVAAISGKTDRRFVASLPASPPAPAGGMPGGEAGKAVAFAPPETVSEFHAYPLKRPATVHCEQLNRLLMMRHEGLKVKKDYSYRAPYVEAFNSVQEQRGAVSVAFSFLNSEKEGLGLPLPEGTLRVYEPDKSGQLRYAGASDLPPTPKNKKVNVTLLNAFDVTAAYKTVSSRKIGRRKMRKDVQVVLRNERAQAVKVRVVQGFWSGWNIASASHKHVRLDSDTAQWTIDVPAGQEKKLAFSVDVAR